MVRRISKSCTALMVFGALGCHPVHELVQGVRSSLAPLRTASLDTPQSGRYIVRLKEGVALEPVMALVEGGRLRPLPRLGAFAATLDQAQLFRLRSHPQVEDVEEDQPASLSAQQLKPWWGLERVDHAPREQKDDYYVYTHAGYGVNVYVIDTGIDSRNPEFGGRATNVFNAFADDFDAAVEDPIGHGTAVAGIVGAQTYGVAKGVGLLGIRVFNSAGTSSSEVIEAGIDWLLENVRRPAVANLSIGVNHSLDLNVAVEKLVDAGVFVVVAAGNTDEDSPTKDACERSPGSAPSVMTVAATGMFDSASSLSKGGACVDLYAPGVPVESVGGSYTGTSFAAPMVAGVAALLMDAYGDLAPEETTSWLRAHATVGVLKSVPEGGPNLLLNKVDL